MGTIAMQTAYPIRFSGRIEIRVPNDLPAAVQYVARRHHQSSSEWVRQLLFRGLEAEGVRVSRFPPQKDVDE